MNKEIVDYKDNLEQHDPKEALELGICPCTRCYAGWGMVGANGKYNSCRDMCEHLGGWEDKNREVSRLSIWKDNTLPVDFNVHRDC